MSSAFPISPFDPERENWWSKGNSRLAKRVYDLGLFVRCLRVRMRFGDLRRAPLRMVRLQLRERVAECDWIARIPDPWDEGLPSDIAQRHASLQALKDAVDVRFLLFEMLPDVDAAYLRIYRASPARGRELVIAGHVHRNAASFRSVHSIAIAPNCLDFVSRSRATSCAPRAR
jgi:hypothetical protein